MEELGIIVLLTKWMMYATAVSTWALRFVVPTPDEFKGIFGIPVAPRRYLIFYNLVRWVSGNKSWIAEHKKEE